MNEEDRTLVASIVWRRLDVPGQDFARLARARHGWILEGAAIFVESGRPCHIDYRVELDSQWRTQLTEIYGWVGSERIDIEIWVTPEKQWTLNGVEIPAVAGCIDVDLSFTPATNLLPIRRLDLAVGSSSPVMAAWLRFPELVLEPLDQIYARSAEDRYDYSSSGETFRAVLAVSPSGFVTDYPGLWIEEMS